MNKKNYCRTVSGIRWTAAQRQRIEALLRLPADSPEFEDETEFTVISEVTKEELEMMERENEQKPKKHIKLWLILAAAMLAVGGGAAAGVAAMRKHQNEQNNMDDQIHEMLHLTDDKTVTHILGNRGWGGLNEAKDLCAVETGWYFTDLESDIPVICFTDRETGQIAPLCVRPNCEHNGSEFCTASTRAYWNSGILCYDGYLYAASQKYEYSGDERVKSKAVLLRYEPDGTGITELCDFTQKDCCNVSAAVIYRGYLWVAVSTSYNIEENWQHPNTDYYQNRSGGYEIYGYEMATGKTVKLLSAMASPDEAIFYESIRYLYPDGDYLYVATGYEPYSSKKYPEGLNHCLYRVSLLTGETEAFPELDEMRNDSFSACGDVIYCENEAGTLCKFDITTKEITKLLPDMNDYCTDGEYVYAIKYEEVTRGEDDITFKCTVPIYDRNGNQAGTYDFDENYIDGVYVSEDKLYIYIRYADYPGYPGEYLHEIKCCDAAAFRSGDAEWETVLQWAENENGGRLIDRSKEGSVGTDAQ
ncbi:MAG: hypothetical protein IJ060_05415 [Oscillospiraceae bacterium]|nr:hypothetical protein [Oscillospiraceae bacterium]